MSSQDTVFRSLVIVNEMTEPEESRAEQHVGLYNTWRECSFSTICLSYIFISAMKHITKRQRAYLVYYSALLFNIEGSERQELKQVEADVSAQEGRHLLACLPLLAQLTFL